MKTPPPWKEEGVFRNEPMTMQVYRRTLAFQDDTPIESAHAMDVAIERVAKVIEATTRPALPRGVPIIDASHIDGLMDDLWDLLRGSIRFTHRLRHNRLIVKWDLDEAKGEPPPRSFERDDIPCIGDAVEFTATVEYERDLGHGYHLYTIRGEQW